MKTSEILPAVLAGAILAVGEYRGYEVRALPDGKNIICQNWVIIGRESVPIETFAPKGYTLEQAKTLAPLGIKSQDRVVVRDFQREQTKWGLRGKGLVELLTKD